MSDRPTDYRDRLTLKEQITRIDRAVLWILLVTVIIGAIGIIVPCLPEILTAWKALHP